MAKFLVVAMISFTMGCSSHRYVTTYPKVDTPVPLFSDTPKVLSVNGHLEAFRVATSYEAEPAPISWPDGGCAVNIADERFGDPHNQIVLRLTKVTERWVPIEGSPKRYYEFSVY